MKRIGLLLIASASLFAWSCLNEDNGFGDRNPAQGTEFDYAMTKVYNLDVNYALNGYETPVQFAVYTEYPFISESSRQLKDIEPALRGYVDQAGKYTGTVLLPIGTQKVYLYTPAYGVIQSVELPVTATGIAYDANAEVAVRSRAATRAGGAPAGIDISVTGGWNAVGQPLTHGGVANLPGSVTSLLNGVFKEGQSVLTRYPALKGKEGAFDITKNNGANRVLLTMLHASGADLNTLCYYTYPTGTTPDLSQVHLTMALPNATFQNGSQLKSGFTVDLKYWNGSQLVAGFPKGTSVAFCVIKDGFNMTTGNVENNAKAFCHFNVAGQPQQMIGFRGPQGNSEAYFAYDSDGDNDFNDLIFFIDTKPSNTGELHIDVVVDPQDPQDDPDPQPVPTVYNGTLIFEDLWPYRGDYDMNDVVLEYSCTVWTNTDNLVVRVEDVFRPIHNGAQLQNAVAYQYGVRPDQVKSMTFTETYPGGFGEAKNYKALPWLKNNGFEVGQTLANILLFDDIRRPKLASGDYSYKIATEFVAPVSITTLGYPPYNPYIVIVYPQDDNNRGRELHLASYPGGDLLPGQYYPPTDKASSQWFGKGMDKSQPEQRIFYVSADMYPFAINVPMHSFVLPGETQKIDQRYPQFYDWAVSKGAINPEWYKHPN